MLKHVITSPAAGKCIQYLTNTFVMDRGEDKLINKTQSQSCEEPE